MDKITLINAEFIETHTHFEALIEALKIGFSTKEIIVPMRHHHDFPNPEVQADSTLLLMPAWQPGLNAGVKIVTVNPENARFNLPSIQGSYIYLDALKGTIKAIIEAKNLTAKRTAAASALASSFLSRKNSSSLLMIGTGALSINLIRAHAAVRPITQVFIWGRDFDKAKALCKTFQGDSFSCTAIEHLEQQISNVDIISCATLSKTPLVLGRYLKPGQHVDLVGSYKKDMREADNDTILKTQIFVDTFEGATKETGDIVIPLQEGIISINKIKADLFMLCSNTNLGRETSEEITLFKSVGHALEDLVAATYYYQKHTHV